jgi:cardiolipin synthase A/B
MKKKSAKSFSTISSSKRLKRSLMGLLLAFMCSIAFWIQEQHQEIRFPDSAIPIELYSNQVNGDLTHMFASAINQAQKSVLLMVYSLTDQNIINCLKHQSQNGVDVKVICHAKASPYIHSKLGDQVTLTRRFGPGLMHQKILVVDGQKVWLGSANMTTESLGLHGNLVTAFHSESMAHHIHAKADTLDIESKGVAFPSQDFTVGGQQVELWFLPDNQKAVQRLKQLIQSAQKTIRIAMFTWTRYDLAKAVIDAANRGVKTEVVIDYYAGKGAGSKVVNMLKDSGISIGLSTGSQLLHHKFLYIDGKTLINGSANWTKAAFHQNDDCFMVVHDLTEQQNRQMEALWNIILKESSPP